MTIFDLPPLRSLTLLLGVAAMLGGCPAAGDDDDSTEDPLNAALVTVDGAPVDVPNLIGFLVTNETRDGRFASIEAGTSLTCAALEGFAAAQRAAFDVIDAATTPDWDEWDRAMGEAEVEFYGDGSWSAEIGLGEVAGDPALGAHAVALGISLVDADRVGDPLGANSHFFSADYPSDLDLLSVDGDGATFTASGTGEWTNQTTNESSGTVTVTFEGTVTRCELIEPTR